MAYEKRFNTLVYTNLYLISTTEEERPKLENCRILIELEELENTDQIDELYRNIVVMENNGKEIVCFCSKDTKHLSLITK